MGNALSMSSATNKYFSSAPNLNSPQDFPTSTTCPSVLKQQHGQVLPPPGKDDNSQRQGSKRITFRALVFLYIRLLLINLQMTARHAMCVQPWYVLSFIYKANDLFTVKLRMVNEDMSTGQRRQVTGARDAMHLEPWYINLFFSFRN